MKGSLPLLALSGSAEYDTYEALFYSTGASGSATHSVQEPA
jgi:hypothetical protein